MRKQKRSKGTRKFLARMLALTLAILLGFSGLEPLAVVKAQKEPAKTGKEQTANTKKDEVVYVSLGSDGEPEGTYVVNSFKPEKPGEIRDYGQYESVKNLSTTDPIEAKNGEIRIPIQKADQFFYQGNAPKAELPWQVKMTYSLDGKEMKAEDLAGKAGHVQIHGSIRPRKEADPIFSKYYLLMLTMNFDARKAHIQELDGGRLAYEGTNMVVNYIVLPGDDLNFTMELDTDDFAMGAYNIAGIPFNVDVKLPDLGSATESLRKLEQAIVQLNTGTGQLAQGGELINQATLQLYQYLFQIAKGAEKAAQGSDELANGEELFQGGLVTFGEGIRLLVDKLQGAGKSLDQLKTALTTLAGAESQLTEGTGQYQQGLDQYIDGVNKMADQLSMLLDQLNAFLDDLPADFNPWGDLSSDQQDAMLDEIILSLRKAVKSWEELQQLTPKDQQKLYDQMNQLLKALEKLEADIDHILKEISDLLDKELQDADKLQEMKNKTKEEIQPIIEDVLKAELPKIATMDENTLKQLIEEGLKIYLKAHSDQSDLPTDDNQISDIADFLAQMLKNIASSDNTEQIAESLSNQIAEAVAEKTAQSYLNSLQEIQDRLKTLQESLSNPEGLKQQIERVCKLLRDLMGEDRTHPFPEINRLMEELREPMEKLEALLSSEESIRHLKEQIKTYLNGLKTPGEYQDQLSSLQGSLGQLKQGGKMLSDNIKKIHQGQEQLTHGLQLLNEKLGQADLTQLDQLSRIDQAVDDLIGGHGRLAMGARDLSNGLYELSGGINQYTEGFSQYSEQLALFMDGINRLHDGTSIMKKETAGMSDKANQQVEKFQKIIDKYMQKGFEMHSFVSPRNTELGLVQFVYMSQPVAKEEEPVSLPPKEKKSFWEKLKELFSQNENQGGELKKADLGDSFA